MTTLYVDSPPPRYQDQVKNQFKRLPSNAKSYVRDLFPIVNWITKYNLIWLSGDLTAAITVGTLVIPQSLAYAKMANLPPVFGLYTSFVGVIIYPLFGTSKDVSIGVSAILSLMVGQAIGKFLVSAQYLAGEWTIAQAAIHLSLFAGFVIFLIGLLRLGSLFHFICLPAINGFMAGSGLTIVINQFAKIFGVPNISTTEVPYLVFGKTLINLHHSTVDAAFGITALIYLYGVRYYSQRLLAKYPQHGRLIFFFNSTRSIVVLVFGTLITFMINHFGKFQKSPINIIGDIPAGFNHMGVPQINTDILSFFISDLPGIIVLSIMEHGAVATSIGKVSDYTVNMSNEAFASGLANIFGAFFCSYPAAGAFSRTAVMSKSGTRTPMTSFFVGIIVVLAIYVFTPAFKYIPNAALSAIIAHSVTDLIFGPSTWKKFWDLNPTELFIFALAYIISLVTRIDISVYVPVLISLIIQLYRVARPKYAILGRMDLDPERGQQQYSMDEKLYKNYDSNETDEFYMDKLHSLDRAVFFPLDHASLGKYTHPIDADIICFQPQESVVFQNSAYLFEKLLDEINTQTRRGKPLAEKIGDRSWNYAESPGKAQEKPILQAVILDLSGVHQMDYSGMEALRSTAVQVERYTGHQVDWYIVTGYSATVRKSLLFAGFGNQRRDLTQPGHFLSDLRHGIEEGGHTPGIKGCCSHVEERVIAVDEKKQAANYGKVVTIEQAQQHTDNKAELGHESVTTLDSTDIENNAELNQVPSADDSAQWCYCTIRTANLTIDERVSRITAVHDLYPFFFRSLHDAVRTAIIRKENTSIVERDHELDQISVISDRGGDVSPSVKRG